MIVSFASTHLFISLLSSQPATSKTIRIRVIFVFMVEKCLLMASANVLGG
jgi:hypothetical protein